MTTMFPRRSAVTIATALALLGSAQAPDAPPSPSPPAARQAMKKAAGGAIRAMEDFMVAKSKAAGPERGPLGSRMAPPAPAAPATESTRVALDFKDQPVARVVQAINARSGAMLDLLGPTDTRWNESRATLESPAPVPLWEAVDRLSEGAGLHRELSQTGPFGNPRPRIQLRPGYATAGVDLGPAAYVGPFRLGPVTIHEHAHRGFAAARRPTGPPTDVPPGLSAAIPLVAEPELLWLRTGPIRALEAVDDAGRSLLDPTLGGIEPESSRSAFDFHEPKALVVPLTRPDGPSRRLATLKGVVPLEVARRPAAPTIVVPLKETIGKTIMDGNVSIHVRDFKTTETGVTTVALTVRIEGPRGKADPAGRRLLNARLYAVFYNGLEIVDASGRPVSLSGGGGPDYSGAMQINYTHTSGLRGEAPAILHIYRANWVAWDLPFAFRDLPLPWDERGKTIPGRETKSDDRTLGPTIK